MKHLDTNKKSILAGAALAATILFSQAASALTTFEEYRDMDNEQRIDITSRALNVIFEHAVQQKDYERASCIIQTYARGEKEDVMAAHARLEGTIDGTIGHHPPDGRVEYLVENHVAKVCPWQNTARAPG